MTEKILKPLRKITITGNSLEPKKEGFVLTHLKNFIALERKTAQRSLKNKSKQPVKDKKKEESNIGLLLEVDYAQNAIKDWEDTASELTKLIKEDQGQQVLDSLLEATKLSQVCKESLVFCLVILIKKSENVNIISKSYSAVPQICQTSNLLMLFIETCKLYTTANSKNSGWGRGMKRAIRNWYLQWDPKALLLEVTRYPSAHTWSHKDVLKMSHISLKDLPTGTKITLHYIFSGYDSVKKKFESEPNASEYIQLIDTIQKGSDELTNTKATVERGKAILTTFGSISLRDFSTQAVQDIEVLTFLVESGSAALIVEALATTNLFQLTCGNTKLRETLVKKMEEESFASSVDPLDTILAYNSCRRSGAEFVKTSEEKTPSETRRDKFLAVLNSLSFVGEVPQVQLLTQKKPWLKMAAPSLVKPVRKPVPRCKPRNDFFFAFGRVVDRCFQDVPKMEEKVVVCVDLESNCNKFVSVLPEDPISKEMRGTQILTYIAFGLSSSSSWESVMPELGAKVKATEEKFGPCPFRFVNYGLEMLARTRLDCQMDIDTSLKLAMEAEASTCVYCCSQLTKELMKKIHDAFVQLKEKDSELKLRLAVCVLDPSEDVGDGPSTFLHPDLLFIFGFNRFTLPLVRAFSAGLC